MWGRKGRRERVKRTTSGLDSTTTTSGPEEVDIDPRVPLPPLRSWDESPVTGPSSFEGVGDRTRPSGHLPTGPGFPLPPDRAEETGPDW